MLSLSLFVVSLLVSMPLTEGRPARASGRRTNTSTESLEKGSRDPTLTLTATQTQTSSRKQTSTQTVSRIQTSTQTQTIRDNTATSSSTLSPTIMASTEDTLSATESETTSGTESVSEDSTQDPSKTFLESPSATHSDTEIQTAYTTEIQIQKTLTLKRPPPSSPRNPNRNKTRTATYPVRIVFVPVPLGRKTNAIEVSPRAEGFAVLAAALVSLVLLFLFCAVVRNRAVKNLRRRPRVEDDDDPEHRWDQTDREMSERQNVQPIPEVFSPPVRRDQSEEASRGLNSEARLISRRIDSNGKREKSEGEEEDVALPEPPPYAPPA